MIIQIGQVYMNKVTDRAEPYPNKTRKYLLPCLRDYGDTFIKYINNVFKVAVGIGDMIVDRFGTAKFERHVFILIDSSKTPKHFLPFLEFIWD